ncbi:MAG: nucleoside deaminase [Arcobacteraceae bacterium]|jgi:guanine deaminase|nr:nucleoside deaminase [Arcobacteraceae bacterium]MDY0365291.1 nucleoside deaminase [Arcobacteraceae bacterium]
MNKFMKQAIKESKKGMLKNHGGPFGAVIVKDGKIISSSHNQVLKTNDPTSHAEINAIRKASQKLQSYDLSGCDIYTSCMPCPMCLGAIKWANISNIYYGATSEDADKIGFRDLIFYEDKDQNLININRKEALEVFRLWSEKEDKKLY